MEVAQTCWSSPGGRCLELQLGPRLRRGWRLVGESDTAARESGFPPGNVAQCVLWWKVPSRGDRHGASLYGIFPVGWTWTTDFKMVSSTFFVNFFPTIKLLYFYTSVLYFTICYNHF